MAGQNSVIFKFNPRLGHATQLVTRFDWSRREASAVTVDHPNKVQNPSPNALDVASGNTRTKHWLDVTAKSGDKEKK